MPTGYTAGVKSDTTFEEFAWTCARAFGALILMRDEPTGAPIPEEFKPSEFYREELDKAMARVAEVTAWDEVQAEADMTAKIAEERKTLDRMNGEAVEKRNAYNRMLALVMAWEPPSPDHVAMKDFMIQQLTESRKFDCDHTYEPDIKAVTPSEWKSQQLDQTVKHVTRYREEWRKEVERTDGRNKWVQQLRESLAEKVTA